MYCMSHFVLGLAIFGSSVVCSLLPLSCQLGLPSGGLAALGSFCASEVPLLRHQVSCQDPNVFQAFLTDSCDSKCGSATSAGDVIKAVEAVGRDAKNLTRILQSSVVANER